MEDNKERPIDLSKSKPGDIIMFNGKLMQVAKLISDEDLEELAKKHGITIVKDSNEHA